MVLISACSEIDVSQLSDEDLERISEKAVVCNDPYMRFGTGCCLDNNTNSICDEDEFIEELEPESIEDSEVISPPTQNITPISNQTIEDNYTNCINVLLKTECKKYDLIYTDYNGFPGFITCTDDGAYTFDDIGDSSKYLQVYAPTRTLQIKCGTYQEPLATKEKCKEDLFQKLCIDNNLVYTDYNAFPGFITCSDDGFYTLEEIGDGSKYKQVYITDIAINDQC